MKYICRRITRNKLKTTLQNIASIQSGIYVKPDSFGSIVYLQGKHFNENGQLNTSLIPDLQLTNQTERHLLQHGDILIAAKGNKNFATVYEERNGLCVASSTFMVIRIKPDWKKKISSEFLSWYINHPNTQLWLKTNSIGSAVQSISKVTLSEMELLIPNIDKQHSILKINAIKKIRTKYSKTIS